MNFQCIELPKLGLLQEKDLAWVGPDTRIQHKLDGHFRYLGKDSEGKPFCYGRRDSTVTGRRECVLGRVGPTVRGMIDRVPPGTAIAGEVVAGSSSMDVPTLMASDSPDLRFLAFGLLAFDKLYSYRRVDHDEAYCKDLGVPWVPYIHPTSDVGRAVVTAAEARRFDLVGGVLGRAQESLNIEGFVLKNGAYGPAAKFKPALTYDVVIMGYTDAEFGVGGKYFGQIGAIRCGMYDRAGKLVEVALVSGMTDEERLGFTSDRSTGAVIEIAAQGWTGRGRLRHPRFKRLRPDKGPEQCLLPSPAVP